MSQFSDSLKSIRKKSSKKQREVAEYLGINLRTYQNYEGGRSEPSIAQLIKLADFFMVSLDELVGRDWIGG
ncbi:helix-turn-helix domain-containing protein [Flintibacter muris]|uniref:helix-turn-helix domain-containing protein n=1 Tax=Flintibacter muris TaxID=2941327 RepID=UPI00203F2430|nr:helix-turn-helix transcriptional regulator [Flintibacter muris]